MKAFVTSCPFFAIYLSGTERVNFAAACAAVTEAYLDTLREDVSWFCKKFDYRYEAEPWKNSKDSVDRAILFLRGNIHNP